MTTDARDRLRRLPRIRRAREYRLYTVDGRRIVDLWQAGGRAILGHRGAGVVSAVKRVLEHGTLAPLPSVQERRLEQTLRRLFPERPELRVAVYASEERAIAAVSRALGVPAAACIPADPVFRVFAAGGAGESGGGGAGQSNAREAGAPGGAAGGALRPGVWYWRPFLPADEAWAALVWSSVLLPILPDGGLFPVQPVVYPADLGLDLVSDLVPESALAALTSGAHGLASSDERRVFALDAFTAIGPYLVPDPTDRYDRVFDGCLASGVLISPDPGVPSIVPGVYSDGERTQIITAVRRVLSE